MVIKNRLRFFAFFFFFISVLFIAVKSCVNIRKPAYVEVEADKVSPVPTEIKNSDALVHFIEEVKESKSKEEEVERELSQAEIEAKEDELRRNNEIKKKTLSKNKKRIKKRTHISKARTKPQSKLKIPSDITLSGGEQSLSGLSKARLESYTYRIKNSEAKKIYITGFYLGGESKSFGFARAEKVKRLLIGAGLRDRAIYVSSKKAQRSPSSVNFNWSKVSAY